MEARWSHAAKPVRPAQSQQECQWDELCHPCGNLPVSARAEERLRVIRNDPTTERNSVQLFLGPLGLSFVTGPLDKKGSNVSPRSEAKHGTISKTLRRKNTKTPFTGLEKIHTGKRQGFLGNGFLLLVGGPSKSSSVPRHHSAQGHEAGAQGARGNLLMPRNSHNRIRVFHREPTWEHRRAPQSRDCWG